MLKYKNQKKNENLRREKGSLLILFATRICDTARNCEQGANSISPDHKFYSQEHTFQNLDINYY